MDVKEASPTKKKTLKEIQLEFPRRSLRLNLPKEDQYAEIVSSTTYKRKRRANKKKPRAESKSDLEFGGKFKVTKYRPKQYDFWAKRRKKLWDNIGTDPNKYYYHFCGPGEEEKTDKNWTKTERKNFIKTLKEHPIKSKNWGLFSMNITGRTGKECESQYKSVIKDKPPRKRRKKYHRKTIFGVKRRSKSKNTDLERKQVLGDPSRPKTVLKVTNTLKFLFIANFISEKFWCLPLLIMINHPYQFLIRIDPNYPQLSLSARVIWRPKPTFKVSGAKYIALRGKTSPKTTKTAPKPVRMLKILPNGLPPPPPLPNKRLNFSQKAEFSQTSFEELYKAVRAALRIDEENKIFDAKGRSALSNLCRFLERKNWIGAIKERFSGFQRKARGLEPPELEKLLVVYKALRIECMLREKNVAHTNDTISIYKRLNKNLLKAGEEQIVSSVVKYFYLNKIDTLYTIFKI